MRISGDELGEELLKQRSLKSGVSPTASTQRNEEHLLAAVVGINGGEQEKRRWTGRSDSSVNHLRN